ncbi:MAG: TetR/AcrR family transcriptional regulator [Burkholderiaceae bacterium]
MSDSPKRKGQQTKASIIVAATEMAARDGLEGLTIGALADRAGMSKSGVFAHFGSREELQLAALNAYEQVFINEILAPALKQPRGLSRLVHLVERWLAYTANEARSGCILVSAAFEYHSRPGAVRDALVAMISGWQRELATAIKQAVQTGELLPDTDVDDLVFGLNGVVLAVHHDARLLQDADAFSRGRSAFNRLLQTALVNPVPDQKFVSESNQPTN